MKPVGPFICESCGHAGRQRKVTPGSFLIEIVLWCCFLLPGFLYTLWRITNKRGVCPSCSGKMIPCDSPRGRKMARELYPDAVVRLD